MEQKTHWAWPLFTSGQVAKERLHLHFEQEYEVYTATFPFYWMGLCSMPWLKCENWLRYSRKKQAVWLPVNRTQNILRYPRGLGYDMSRFEAINHCLPQKIPCLSRRRLSESGLGSGCCYLHFIYRRHASRAR